MKSIFIDKNPFFHYAQKRLFNEEVPKHSLELIEKIKDGDIEASIESMTIFATHNYAVHKMIDPKRNAEKFVSKADAEKETRKFIKYLFRSKSWKFIGMTHDAIANALNDENFNFEDACQYHAFKLSQCELFITWNIRDFRFKEAMTPKDFLLKNKGFNPSFLIEPSHHNSFPHHTQ